jgi:hypothetical protein
MNSNRQRQHRPTLKRQSAAVMTAISEMIVIFNGSRALPLRASSALFLPSAR